MQDGDCMEFKFKVQCIVVCGRIDKIEKKMGKVKKWKLQSVECLWVEIQNGNFFGKIEKVKKIICRSVGIIDKMEIFWGKVKKWKKRSIEGLWVKLTKYIFLGEK